MFCRLLHRRQVTERIAAGAWRDEDCPQDAEGAEKQTENKACAEAALFSVCDGPRDCATPNQDNHQSR